MFLEEMAFILLTVAIVQAQSARVLSRFSSVFKIGFQFGFENSCFFEFSCRGIATHVSHNICIIYSAVVFKPKIAIID